MPSDNDNSNAFHLTLNDPVKTQDRSICIDIFIELILLDPE